VLIALMLGFMGEVAPIGGAGVALHGVVAPSLVLKGRDKRGNTSAGANQFASG
jgi:hypothetical protein